MVTIDWQAVEVLRTVEPERVRLALRERRRARNLTQDEVSRLAGYDDSLVGQVERGYWYPRRPDGFVTVIRLLAAVGLAVDELEAGDRLEVDDVDKG
jgi:transcriptional regulator with XRE-family HTH domain